MGKKIYPWVVSVPDLKQNGYITGNFFRLWVTRRVPEKIEIFNLDHTAQWLAAQPSPSFG
jgi:hypothetical protein